MLLRALDCMRRPLCLLAVVVPLAIWVVPASAVAATPPSSSGSLIEGLGGGAGTESGKGGSAEEGEAAEGTEAAKRTGTGTSSSEESSGLGSLPLIFGMGGAAVLIAAIAVFILRDARKNAPVLQGAFNGVTRISPSQVRKRRAKAKAVKQQRKRNRPR